MGPGEISLGLNIFDRLRKLLGWYRAKWNPPAESVATRFIRLFESHGVHRNQIPRFFGHGLALRHVQDDAALIAKLDETMLEAACSKFAIRREWLDGAELEVYEVHDYYKHPEDFAVFLECLKAKNPEVSMNGTLIAPVALSSNAGALLVLQETVGYLGDKAIDRYHLCGFASYTYWKTMAYLTACVALAWKRRVYVHGVRMPTKAIHQLASGKMLPDWHCEGVWQAALDRWHPEDMALQPAAFLKDVDPERGDFGIMAGLDLWLALDERGLMDTGIGAGESDVRRLFQQARER